MTYKEFLGRLIEDEQYYGGDLLEYVHYHARRFYTSYKFSAKYLKPGDKILSVGAGIASIEKMLHGELGYGVTIVDFPETIEENKAYYDKLGLKSIKADASSDINDLPSDHYDMIIYSEIIEHIPVAPSIQLEKLKRYLKKGGKIVVTTPNQGSIFQIARLLMMQPILPPPERTFGPVCVENQGIHRREYLPVEMKDAFATAGYKFIETKYFLYTHSKKIGQTIAYMIGNIIPRFKQGMMLVAEKQ